jgi:hypothetical protein
LLLTAIVERAGTDVADAMVRVVGEVKLPRYVYKIEPISR